MSRQPFRYQSRDDSDYETRASRSGGDFESFVKSEYKLYKPHQGDNYIRFLPPTFDDARHYGIDVWVHYGIGPDEASVICLQKMKKEPCPICEARIIADRRGDSTLADDLKPNRRVLVWLLDMKESSRDRRPLLWAMGGSTDLDFTKYAKDRETGTWRRVDHPDDGLNVSFDRGGEGIKTRYTGFQYSSKPSSVPDDDLDYIMDNPLPDTLRWRTYEEVAELFDGGTRGRGRDDNRRDDRGRSSDRDRPRNDDRPDDRSRGDDRRDDRPSDTRTRSEREASDNRGRSDTRDGRDRPRDNDRPDDRRGADDTAREPDNRDRPRSDDRRDDRPNDSGRSAQATSDELRRRWNTDAPRDQPRDPPRDDTSDAPRRRRD